MVNITTQHGKHTPILKTGLLSISQIKSNVKKIFFHIFMLMHSKKESYIINKHAKHIYYEIDIYPSIYQLN